MLRFKIRPKKKVFSSEEKWKKKGNDKFFKVLMAKMLEGQAGEAEVARPLRSWRRGVSSRVGIAAEERRRRGDYDTAGGDL